MAFKRVIIFPDAINSNIHRVNIIIPGRNPSLCCKVSYNNRHAGTPYKNKNKNIFIAVHNKIVFL